MWDQLLALDHGLLDSINQHWASPLLDGFMSLVSDQTFWLIVPTVIAAIVVIRRPRAWTEVLLFGVLIGGVDSFCYRVLKPEIGRLRPCYQRDDLRLIEKRCGGDFGFPSNHAANGMAAAAFLHLRRPRRYGSRLLFGLAVVVGYSRVYLGVHFVSDVLAGFLIGGGSAWLWAWLLAAAHRRWPARLRWLAAPLSGKPVHAPTAGPRY